MVSDGRAGAPEEDPHHRGNRGLCARAQQEGAKPRQVRAAEAINRTIAALVISLRAALDQSHAEIEAGARRSRRLAFAAAKKIAPAALAALPAGDVEAALREAMHQAIGEPRITLRAAPEVIAALEAAHRGHRP